MPILLPPLVAVLGVIATAFIIRTRYRVKQSLYTSVRQQRAREILKARNRALAATTAGDDSAPARGESALEIAFGLTSLVAALGLVLMGVVMAIGARS